LAVAGISFFSSVLALNGRSPSHVLCRGLHLSNLVVDRSPSPFECLLPPKTKGISSNAPVVIEDFSPRRQIGGHPAKSLFPLFHLRLESFFRQACPLTGIEFFPRRRSLQGSSRNPFLLVSPPPSLSPPLSSLADFSSPSFPFKRSLPQGFFFLPRLCSALSPLSARSPFFFFPPNPGCNTTFLPATTL